MKSLLSHHNIFFGPVLAASLAGHAFLLLGSNFFYKPPGYTVELASSSMEVVIIKESYDDQQDEITNQEYEIEQDTTVEQKTEIKKEETVDIAQDEMIREETEMKQDEVIAQEVPIEQDEVIMQEREHTVNDQLNDSVRPVEEKPKPKVKKKKIQKKDKNQKPVLASPKRGAVEEVKLNVLNNRAPLYPVLAREKGWQGTVILKVLVRNEGRPGQILIDKSSGYKILDEAALKAVQNWQFFPRRIANIPFASWVKVPIRFCLEEKEKDEEIKKENKEKKNKKDKHQESKENKEHRKDKKDKHHRSKENT